MSQTPPHYNDLFPPSYNTLCLQVSASMTQTQRYSSPESFPLDPLLPTPYLAPSHNQSLMTLMCFPQTPLIMIPIQIGICNPSPHTPYILILHTPLSPLIITLHTSCSNS